MIIYYELFSSGAGNVEEDIYEFVLSSNGRNNVIEFYDKQEKARHSVISNYFKQIPLAVRQYEAATHVTTLIGIAGKRMVVVFETLINAGFPGGVSIKQITDLQDKLQKGRLNYVEPVTKARTAKEVEIKFKEEDFFHKPEAPKGELSGEALWIALSNILEIPLSTFTATSLPELKRSYRMKALHLHPDRPGGDADKMATLNKLWALYTS